MPPELDPAYARFARRETPTEGMKRIERDLRSDDFEYQERPSTQRNRLGSSAGRSNLEGYNASIGAQGPLSAGLIAAGDPESGKPTMVGGRAQAGPLSYQYTQPTQRGAPPSQQIGATMPFDADAYFGVTAQQGADGRTYGANMGGEGWNVSGGYNPRTKALNANFGYQSSFAFGGPVTNQTLAAQIVPPEEQSPIEGEQAGSPSWEGVGKVLGTVGQGFNEIYKTPPIDPSYTTGAGVRRDITPMTLGEKLDPKIHGGGSPGWEDVSKVVADLAHDPAGLVAGALPIIGNLTAAKDLRKVDQMIDQLEARGDTENASKLKKMAGYASAGVIIPGAAGVATKEALRVGESALLKGAEQAGVRGAEHLVADATGVAKRAAEGEAVAAVNAAEGAGKAAEQTGRNPTQAAEQAAMASRTDSLADDMNRVLAKDDRAPPVDGMHSPPEPEKAPEHVMGTERAERKTIDPSSVKLTPGERDVVNGFKDDMGKFAKVQMQIRQTKARYPVSDGWAPIEAIGAEFDDKGNVVLKWQEQTYGYNKGKVTSEKPVIDPETGKPRKQPKLDAEGKPVLDEEGKPVMTGKNVTEEVTDVRALRPNTPQYDQLVTKAVNNGAKDILNVVKRAKDGDEAANVILRQLGWYREFMRKGFDERGGSYPAFSDLLGATSPNTAVDQNYRYSVEAQKRFARGDFDPQVQAAKDYAKSGASLTDFPEDQLIRRSDAYDPKTGEFKQYGMNSRNAQMAMADLWREREAGQAPKARNFSGNLGGATEAATIDVWAARFLNRMVNNKRLPPPVESGVKGKLALDKSSVVGERGPQTPDYKPGGEFGFGQDVFQKLSDKLNKSNELKPYLQQLGYDNVTPMDLQALTWFIEKEHWTKKNWTTKAGEGGSFEDEMLKYPSSRWQSGFSITQGDVVPTDESMAVTRRIIENTLRKDDAVEVYRVHPTYGRYAGADERSFDIELTAKPNWNPSHWMGEIIAEAKGANQYDAFFSRRLSASEAANNANARPGVEIYFQDRKSMEAMLPVLEEFTTRGQDGFTFTTDLRLRERRAGGKDMPDYVGVRLQFVPEIRMRWDDEFRDAVMKDPTVLQKSLDDTRATMYAAIDALDKNGAKIVDARVHHYDTLVVGKESYDEFLKGILDPEKSSGVYEAGSSGVDPLKRLGQSLYSHVEGRDRALRKRDGKRSPDASPAMDEPNGQVKFAKGGGVTLTHYSRKPDLTEVDPAYYATHNPGEDVSRTLGRRDGNPHRSYFYVGHPGDVMPEHDIGEHAYTTRSDKLYDLSKDPLKLNRGGSAGALNNLEKAVRAHGYEGIIANDASHPTAVLFTKKAVQRHPSTRTGAAHHAAEKLAKQAVADFQDFHNRRGGDVRKAAMVVKNMDGFDLPHEAAFNLANHLVNGNTRAVQSAIIENPGIARGISKMFHKRLHGKVN